MVRADNKQDSDQPHFYSQYWIDVASGKPSASLSSAPIEVEEEEDLDDLSFAQPEIVTKPKVSKPVEKKPDVAHSTLTSLADLANIDLLMKNSAEMDDTMMPDITAGLGETAGADTGFDLPPEVAEEPAEAATPEDEFPFEDEEEEDDEWGGARRKKGSKPKRREHREY
jgi:hypothetical protein